MNIYITGIAGFLGSNLSHSLKNSGHTVFGIDNLVGGNADYINKNAIGWSFDCTDSHDVYESLKLARPEVIIHTACYPHEGLSIFSPKEVCDSVTNATTTVLSAAIDLRNKNVIPFRKFINMSSMARYGDATVSGLFTEDAIPTPKDPYGAHKYAAELTVKTMSEVHGFDYVNLIPHNIYGKFQKYNDPLRNVIAIMIHRALRGEPLYVYGDGSQIRCFSYVDDILPAIHKCVETDVANGMTLNIGPDEGEVTINDLARMISGIHCTKANRNCEIIHVNARPNEVRHATCSAEKLKSLMGKQPSTSLFEGVSMLYDWIKSEGVRPWDYDSHQIEIYSDLTPVTWLRKM